MKFLSSNLEEKYPNRLFLNYNGSTLILFFDSDQSVNRFINEIKAIQRLTNKKKRNEFIENHLQSKK